MTRSWLSVPGHRQKLVDKAFALDADAIMFDLEDGVAPAEKPAARKLIAEALDRVAARAASTDVHQPLWCVRVNAIGHQQMRADLSAVVRAGLDALILPKVEATEQLTSVDDLLTRGESEAGLTPGRVRLLPVIESARGLLNVFAIASVSPRIDTLFFGAEDFSKELGLPLHREAEARDLLYARSAIVVAGAAARVQIVDAVWPDIHDADGLRRFALQGRRLGFTGMAAIHPSQIGIINDIYSPTREEANLPPARVP